MKMRKIIAILFSAVLLLSACSAEDIQKSKEEQEPSDTPKPEQKDPSVDPYADLPSDVENFRWQQGIALSGWDDGWRTWNGWRVCAELDSFLTDPDYVNTFEYKGMTDREAWDELTNAPRREDVTSIVIQS